MNIIPTARGCVCDETLLKKLYEYKVRNGIPTWEEVIERVIANADEPVRT